jgi:uncharacterized membrane protein (DUF373 family)
MTQPTTPNHRLQSWAHRFEFLVVVALFAALAAISVIALVRLGIGLFDVATVPERLTETHAVQKLFGMVMTVLIALEFGNSILRHLAEHEVIIQAREIILISMMAVVRKIMLVDLSQDEPLVLVWLGITTLVLAGAYWLMGQRDRKA